MGKFWTFLSNLPLGGINILLVDDNKKFLEKLAERIRLKGYEPYSALNGHEAIEITRTTKIHVAVVDQRMPDMDGLVVITKLKEIDAGIKTVLLTAHGDEKLQEATEALNASYFEKENMGKFWGFIRKMLQGLENSMAAAGMASELYTCDCTERLSLRAHFLGLGLRHKAPEKQCYGQSSNHVDHHWNPEPPAFED